jgi:putative DNA primase/helicase
MNALHQTALSIGINPERLPHAPTIGKWYYLPLVGKPNSNTSGRFKALGVGVAFMQNMATGDKVTHFDDKPTDKAELARWQKEAKAAQQQAYREQQKKYEQAAIMAHSVWFDCAIAPDLMHPYLVNKRLKPYGLRQYSKNLVVPVYSFSTGKIQSLQYIYPQKDTQGNDKRFITGGRMSGGYFAARRYKTGEQIVISEGWATSQSLAQQWHVDGWHICAFNAGNLITVAKAIRQRYPFATIIIAADNDESGAGQVAAAQAAKAVGAIVSMPEFTAEERVFYGKVSDWQDRWVIDQWINIKEEVRYAD